MQRSAGLIVAFLLASSSSAFAIDKILGASSDAMVPPVPACQTFGFSVESITTLPVGQNNIRMVRIDRSGNTQTGYAVTSQATGYTVYTYDFKTMAPLGSTAITITGYRDAGRIQGDVGSDGKLYLFHEVSTANAGCPSNNCVVMSRWTGSSQDSFSIDSTGAAIANIDDARETGSQFLVAVSDAATRRFRTYSKSSLLRVSSGTNTTIASFAHISRSIDGTLYGMVASNVSSPNIWLFGSENPTAIGTSTIAFTAGTGIGAVFGMDLSANFYVFDSGNTATPQRSYISPPTTAFGTQNFPNGATDGAASFQAGFWDSTNVKVFSLRTGGTSGSPQRSLVGIVPPFTVEENFACASCVNSGGSDTGTQIADYNASYMRMFVGSNESPGRLTKIKVCATGGPAV